MRKVKEEADETRFIGTSQGDFSISRSPHWE